MSFVFLVLRLGFIALLAGTVFYDFLTCKWCFQKSLEIVPKIFYSKQKNAFPKK
ncbi:hypothetical protein Hdeb2414_s0593g00921031 [Helianthus debilis subsp. tardiflorus]